MDNGGCDHYCTETIRSYICSCYPGYTLNTDQHMCVGKSSSIIIIIIIIIIDYIIALETIYKV